MRKKVAPPPPEEEEEEEEAAAPKSKKKGKKKVKVVLADELDEEDEGTPFPFDDAEVIEIESERRGSSRVGTPDIR